MSRRRRRLVEIVLGTIASVALVLSILTAAGAVTLPGLNGGDNDLLALGQGAGQTPTRCRPSGARSRRWSPHRWRSVAPDRAPSPESTAAFPPDRASTACGAT